MKYYRYMSFREFEALCAEENLVNPSVHKNCRTDSQGFCFLGENTTFETEGTTYNFSPIQCYAFLDGIVSSDVLVEFNSEKPLKKGCGVYASPFQDDECIIIDEYSTAAYNAREMVPVRMVRFNIRRYAYSEEMTWISL